MNSRWLPLFLAAIAILEGAVLPGSVLAAEGSTLAYIGTYNGPKSKGIYAIRLDPQSGRWSEPELVAEGRQLSFLALAPGGRFLYSVSEVSDLAPGNSGAVSAFAIDAASGKLTPLNHASAVGAGPCHLVVDKGGRNVLLANYGGGSVAVVPVNADGSLAKASSFVQHKGTSVNKQRQDAPHAHGIYLDPAGRFALVPDLGLDQVLVYRFDPAAGTLTPHDTPFARVAPGAGPRHLAFHPNGKHVYVINEMDCTVTAFDYNAAAGELAETQTLSTLPKGVKVKSGFSTAEIYVHPSGGFVYGSNRGHDTIVVYSVNPKDGKLTLVQHVPTGGRTPRGFGIDPSGTWLLAGNQDSASVTVFRIDPATGKLTSTGQVLEVGSPVTFAFLSSK